MQMLADIAAENRDAWSNGVKWTDWAKREVMIYERVVSMQF